jgi:hypothetical protein
MARNGAFRQFLGKTYLLVPRDYVVQIPHLGGVSQTAVGSIQIDPGAPFLLFDRHMSDTNDPSVAAPGLSGQYENSIQVQDGTQNINWSNDFVSRSGFARDRTMAYRLAQECYLEKGTRLNITIKEPAAGNLAGTTTLTLQGYALYPVTPDGM